MQSGAALLAEWIEKREYTQLKASVLFGISEGYISMILSGGRLPGRNQALRIEELTGIPVRAWSLSADNTSKIAVAAGAGNSKSHKQ